MHDASDAFTEENPSARHRA